MGAVFTIISLILSIIVGLWRYYGRKNEAKRKQGEQARKDLDNANKNDDPSSFIDGFGRL
jgi:hypothetical protein